MASFSELFDRHAFLAFEKQNRLNSLVGELSWSLDVEIAEVAFDESLRFKVQFLGTESTLTNTWLWADANGAVKLPQESLNSCRRARSLGRNLGVEEFARDSFPLEEEVGKPTGHTLSMLATCLANASAYYRGPHENGAVYFLLADPRIDSLPDLDVQGFSKAFNHLIWIPGDMKTRVIAYLTDKAYIKRGFMGDEIRCRLYTGQSVVFKFKRTETGGVEIDFEAIP